MFGALKRGFRGKASLILVRNVVGELRPKRTLAASRGFLAAARLSCLYVCYSAEFCQLCFYNKDWIGLEALPVTSDRQTRLLISVDDCVAKY